MGCRVWGVSKQHLLCFPLGVPHSCQLAMHTRPAHQRQLPEGQCASCLVSTCGYLSDALYPITILPDTHVPTVPHRRRLLNGSLICWCVDSCTVSHLVQSMMSPTCPACHWLSRTAQCVFGRNAVAWHGISPSLICSCRVPASCGAKEAAVCTNGWFR